MSSQDLLFGEPILFLSQKLATKIGLKEAIFLQQLHADLEEHKKKNPPLMEHYWVPCSLKKWQQYFPFWSTAIISKTIQSLERKKLIEKTHFYLGSKRTSSALYYTIKYDALDDLWAEVSLTANDLIKNPDLQTVDL